MRFMGRWKLGLFLFLIAVLAVEPTLHNHSLFPSADGGVNASGSICVVCAVGANQVLSVAPAVHAPQSVAYDAPTLLATFVSSAAPLQLASRAPPLV
jgi:hypothetical protein